MFILFKHYFGSLARPRRSYPFAKSAFQTLVGIGAQPPPASIGLVQDTEVARRNLHGIMELDEAALKTSRKAALIGHYRAALTAWLDRTAVDRLIRFT
jgi:hypothetical protein